LHHSTGPDAIGEAPLKALGDMAARKGAHQMEEIGTQFPWNLMLLSAATYTLNYIATDTRLELWN
jgi:hypothetical protein